MLARNTYDEYGQPSSGNVGLFQYTGQIWLPQAGEAYPRYKARAYAPQLGRFMQADPIGYQAGANLYGYVEMDPINLRDPRGLSSCRTPDYWRVWSYSNSGPTWTEGPEIRRELVGRTPSVRQEAARAAQAVEEAGVTEDSQEALARGT